MRTRPAILMLALSLAACGKKTATKKHTCDDVEAAMRRLDPEHTAGVRKGTFAQLCRDQPLDQARIDCTVEAKTMRDMRECADPTRRGGSGAGL